MLVGSAMRCVSFEVDHSNHHEAFHQKSAFCLSEVIRKMELLAIPMELTQKKILHSISHHSC